MSKEMKILPELRFPDFTNNDQWKADTVQNIVTTKSPPKKLQSSEYLDEGVFPIIDQSQSFYCGYTNDQQAIINEDLPLVIFGDHTCALKMAREPFAQGADGIKILKSKAFIDQEYLYQYLTYNGVKQENYKRHYSKLKEKIVPYPEFESGEQQKIASCLSSLDELKAAHNDKLDALKDHKKGLLQNLFPQKGETVPKVRFPEFEDDGEWVEKKLGDAADFINGRAYKKEELLTSGKYRVLRVGNFFTNNEWYYSDLELGEDKYCDNGDLLYAWSASFGPRIWKEEKVIYHYHIWKVVEKSGIDKQFLFILLDFETENIKAAQARGLGIQHLTKSGIESWESTIPPTKEEQQKIASCLSAVDELITAQQEKIEQLQQHKKGLMQGLFPKIES